MYFMHSSPSHPLPSFWVGSCSINLFVLDLLLIITFLNSSRSKYLCRALQKFPTLPVLVSTELDAISLLKAPTEAT